MSPSKIRKNFAFILLAVMLVGALSPALAQSLRFPPTRGEFVRLRPPVVAKAYSDGQGAFLVWTSTAETGVVAYEVYRYGAQGREKIEGASVLGGGLRDAADSVGGARFTYFDPEGTVSSFYQIEAVRLEGYRLTVASTVAQPVADLAPFAGYSSAELIEARRYSNSNLDTSGVAYPKSLKAEMDFLEPVPDTNAQKWVAAQPGVKLAVKQAGMYRVTRTELEAAGFNVGISTKYWRLFADGSEVALRVAPDGSFIEFYGTGRDMRESDTKVYYLIGGTTKGLRMPSVTSRLTAGPPVGTSFSNNYARRFRSSYLTTLRNGDAENYFGGLVSTTASNFTVALDAFDPAQGLVPLTVRIQGITNTQHSVNVAVNGTQVGTMTGSGTQSYVATFNVAANLFVSGNNTVRLTSTIANAFSLIDTISAVFDRGYVAASNRLSYLSAANKQVTVSGFSSNDVTVYDITNPARPGVLAAPTLTETAPGVFSARVITNRQRALYAAAGNGYLSPASITLNTPSALSDAANQGQMIIVTHQNFMTEANAWAAYRQAQGFTVNVVDVEDVFDEFSYGSRTTDGLNAFFAFAKQNWAVKPDYVLLIGDATYDYRNYEGKPFSNFIPTRLFDTLYEETASDDALVDFNNDGLAEIAIGRIPARTGAVVTQLFNKMQTFESTSSTALASRGGVFAHDQPDGYDFAGLNSRLAAKLPAGAPTTAVSRLETNAKANLVAALNGGPMIVNYSGHGSTDIWAASSFFSQADASGLTNGDRLTVFMMLTCLNGFFHSPDGDKLAETAMKAANGGSVVSWASTGKTTPDVQDVMANRFFTKLTEGSMTRIGDLIRDSKTVIFAGRDVRLSWALLGDPAMKVR